MPDPNKKITEAYQIVEKLTGLKLKDLEQKEVRKLLKKFYVADRNLYSYSNMNRESVDEAVRTLSDTLKTYLNAVGNFNKPIYMIDPDDPFAMPQMIVPSEPLDKQGNAILEPQSDVKEKFEKIVAEADDFKKRFADTHRSNLEACAKKLENYRMPEALKAEDYFDAEAFKNQNVLTSLQDEDNAVGLCSLLLIGRGYSISELEQNGEEVREAKRKAGAQLAAIFDGSLSLKERSSRLQKLVAEAIGTLNQTSFKPVDLSEESTLGNLAYNQCLASMADSLEQVMQDAQQTMTGEWIAKAASDVKKITNFTNGITEIDRLRLNGVAGGLRSPEQMKESALAQVLVEQVGLEYEAYRTTPFGFAGTDLNLLEELRKTMKNDLGAQPEYQQAYEQDSHQGNMDSYKQLLKRDLEKEHNTLADSVKENHRQTSANEAAIKENKLLAWAKGIPGMTSSTLAKEVGRLFNGAANGQPGRWYTMQSLFIGFGCYMAEQRGEKVEIKDFLTDRDLQERTGREAYEFFREHPISSEGTPEQKKDGERHFIKVIAALNRKLAETEIPKYDYTNPEETEANREYVAALKNILVDSHQLQMVVSEETMDEFYEAHGGKDNYNNIFRQVVLAETITNALASQIPEEILETNSLNSIVSCNGNTSKHNAAFTACDLYFLRNYGDEYLGSRIGDLPKDDQQACIGRAAYNVKSMMQQLVIANVDNTKIKKQLKEYLRSYGKKDEAGFEKQMDEKNMQLGVPKPNSPISKGAYDWSAEMPPKEWKKRLEKFYDELDSRDPSLLHSSDEFRDVKKNLKEALDILDKPVDHRINKKAFNERLNKAFNRAGDYIDKKTKDGVGKHFGRKRLNAMKNIRSLLAERKPNTLDLYSVAELFGQKVISTDKQDQTPSFVSDGASRQEKLERGMMRLGMYLKSIEGDESKEAKAKLALVERVIAERGKDSITREKLMNEMAAISISPYADTEILMNQAKEQIIERVNNQQGMDRQAANWCKVLSAFNAACVNSSSQQFQKIAADADVKGFLQLGRVADRAMEAQNKILDVEESSRLSLADAEAVVATATITAFMKRRDMLGYSVKDDEEIERDNMEFFNRFIRNKSDEDLLDYFKKSGDVQAILHENTNDGLKKHVAAELEQVMIGVRGARKICAQMAVEEKREQQQLQKQQPQKQQSQKQQPQKQQLP